MKSKFRIYVLFQFMTFTALLLLCISAIVMMYEWNLTKISINVDISISNIISEILQFGRMQKVGILTSILFYFSFSLWISTWIIGLFILRFKKRNLHDSLFLLFVFLPLISNIIALIAQLSLKEQDYTSSFIDKVKIKEKVKKEIGNKTTLKTSEKIT